MAGDIVYADIKTVRTSPLEHSSPLSRSDSHHHGIFMKVGSVMIIILLVIVIILSILVSSNSSTVHKSCPTKDWKLHGGNCYWVAETKKSWRESQNECAMKNSHLIVIQDFTDMSFLWLYQKSSAFYWIGLTVPPEGESWTWVDNSSFNLSHLFSINKNEPQTRSKKCAEVSGNIITVQNCKHYNQWICEL
ncbi:putative C-type lectin-like domain family 1 isoform X2 [Microcebus murinus]|uniref:killer cell lectin-like receptor subfamily B member 1B allele A isoform X2 n=1 Tax=Microcebus murinus TaxID=30608 RepID=UPI003F6C082E